MAQFKLRLPPALREAIEQSAGRSGNSLNTELVQRLDRSIHQERVLGGPQMTEQMFAMIASFAHATEGKDWTSDPLAYAAGATAVIGKLIRSVPAGENRPLAIQGIISGLVTVLANDPAAQPQEQAPARKERSA